MMVLVTGSRHWSDEGRIRAALEEASPTEVIVGDAPGADRIATRICGQLRIPVRIYPAFWSRHGPVAGPMRNQQMVDLGPDLVLAFLHPQSRGTRDTIRRSEKAGIQVKIFEW